MPINAGSILLDATGRRVLNSTGARVLGDGTCGCPTAIGSPSAVAISGYADGVTFPVCVDCPASANPPWDGTLNYAGLFSGSHTWQGSVLNKSISGRVVQRVEIGNYPGPNPANACWSMIVLCRTVVGVGTFYTWGGFKFSGNTPLGVYTKYPPGTSGGLLCFADWPDSMTIV